jgi:hypothetical protein
MTRTLLAAAAVFSLVAVMSAACGSMPGGFARPPGSPAAGMGTASSASSGASPGVGPRALAAAEAARLARLVRLPAGARERSTPPVVSLAAAPQRLATSYLIDQARWWTVPEPPAATLAYLGGALGSAGLTRSGGGAMTRPGSAQQFLIYGDRSAPAYSSAALVLTVTDDGHGGSAVRADGQVVWSPERTAAENIPLDIAAVDLRAYRGFSPAELVAHVRVTGAPAAGIAKIIDGLRRDNRGLHGCTADTGFRIKATFTSRDRIWVVNDAGCGGVSISAGAKVQPGLLDTPALEHALRAQLGLAPGAS